MIQFKTATSLLLKSPFESLFWDCIEMVKCFSEKSGFFDGYKDYLFIRNKENSYITCIPRSPGKVKFQKDGKDLKLSENNKDDVYRTDYAIWFRNPLEENSGDYSCLMEDDTSIKVTKNLRVIGESFFQQNFSVKLKFQVLIVDRDFFFGTKSSIFSTSKSRSTFQAGDASLLRCVSLSGFFYRFGK